VLDGFVDVLANDLEPAAEHVEPRLAPFRERLEDATGATALLAGSGSALWMPYAGEDAAAEAAASARATLEVPVFVGSVLPRPA
jgi:4-diphosphocytidyl-2C-methyl-D-erythritol kinase